MLLEDDDDQNNFIFDYIFAIEATDDGMTHSRQSLKMTHASHLCAGTPQTVMYQDEEEKPPTAKDDIEFTNLEVAGLELLMLCDASSARCRFFDIILTFLHQCRRERINITKAKGHASFMATVDLNSHVWMLLPFCCRLQQHPSNDHEKKRNDNRKGKVVSNKSHEMCC
jgi:hypothetical protein